ncbi:MAG: AAA family ATPase [Gammaproteobacteria bacterium]
MVKRYLAEHVEKDLSRKMVFVGGPRQVGKTTLAKTLLGNDKGYLNWDILEQRERILKHELPPTSFWCFDEIHKYRLWRNFLKGLYDLKLPEQKI